MLWKGDHFEHCNDFGPPSRSRPRALRVESEEDVAGAFYICMYFQIADQSLDWSQFPKWFVQANASRLDSSSSSFEY